MSIPSENYQIPCRDCVCLPICRNKRIKIMFGDCVLVDGCCSKCISSSSNRTIAVDMMALSRVFNEILDRHLVPCFNNMPDYKYEDIGFADINSPKGYITQNTTKKIQNTYLMFKRTFNVDMLGDPRIRPYLLPIIKDFIDG